LNPAGIQEGSHAQNSCLATFWQHFIPDEQEKALLIEEKISKVFFDVPVFYCRRKFGIKGVRKVDKKRDGKGGKKISPQILQDKNREENKKRRTAENDFNSCLNLRMDIQA
jgi:hypothetical protein